MLAPETTITVVRPVTSSFREATAATAAAAAPSITSRSWCAMPRIAEIRSSSDTTAIRRTCARTMSNVGVSGSRFPLRPSAIVSPTSIPVIRPDFRLVVNGVDAATSTPAVSHPPPEAIAVPLISPPPPTEVTMISTPGTSSRISIATVPAPAITSGCA